MNHPVWQMVAQVMIRMQARLLLCDCGYCLETTANNLFHNPWCQQEFGITDSSLIMFHVPSYIFSVIDLINAESKYELLCVGHIYIHFYIIYDIRCRHCLRLDMLENVFSFFLSKLQIKLK